MNKTLTAIVAAAGFASASPMTFSLGVDELTGAAMSFQMPAAQAAAMYFGGGGAAQTAAIWGTGLIGDAGAFGLGWMGGSAAFCSLACHADTCSF